MPKNRVFSLKNKLVVIHLQGGPGRSWSQRIGSLRVKLAVRNLAFQQKNKRFTNPRGSRNPKNVSPAGMRQSRAEAAVVEAQVVVRGNCMMLSVLHAGYKPRCLSNPAAPSRFIAASATKAALRFSHYWLAHQPLIVLIELS